MRARSTLRSSDGSAASVDLASPLTLEANAAMRSIVRRDTGSGYGEYLEKLAEESGIAAPERADIAKLDRKRPGKGSNADWVHPGDPEARISKMKDGRTRLAHKLEHAVDMESGAVTALTVQSMEGGDTASLGTTLDEAARQLGDLELAAEEVVADKGYHSNGTMMDLKERGLRSYVSEPRRGCQWQLKMSHLWQPKMSHFLGAGGSGVRCR